MVDRGHCRTALQSSLENSHSLKVELKWVDRTESGVPDSVLVLIGGGHSTETDSVFVVGSCCRPRTLFLVVVKVKKFIRRVGLPPHQRLLPFLARLSSMACLPVVLEAKLIRLSDCFVVDGYFPPT